MFWPRFTIAITTSLIQQTLHRKAMRFKEDRTDETRRDHTDRRFIYHYTEPVFSGRLKTGLTICNSWPLAIQDDLLD